ncbi:MAG TPA: helix-turn-helix transcriptional regulator [Thermoanaerobaculia bacterium]|nr:helix-turn-helix transcriptional regulator [Thermoanaerobaculia bacterium]
MDGGERLREARIARCLSLADVAARTHISVATLSRIERNHPGIGLALFLILCEVLRTPPRTSPA